MLKMRPRPGVSLIEVVVATAIFLGLAAAVLPDLVRPNDREQLEKAVIELHKITNGLETARSDNQDWPRRVSHLSAPITTDDNNICGNSYPNGKVKNWDGPYLDRVTPPTGLPIGIGVVQDSMIRTPASHTGGGQIATITIVIEGVTEEHAIELNRMLDDDDSATTGGVRWSFTDASAGIVQVEYIRPIKGC